MELGFQPRLGDLEAPGKILGEYFPAPQSGESPDPPGSPASEVRVNRRGPLCGGPRGFSRLPKPPSGLGQGEAGQERGPVPPLGPGARGHPRSPLPPPGCGPGSVCARRSQPRAHPARRPQLRVAHREFSCTSEKILVPYLRLLKGGLERHIKSALHPGPIKTVLSAKWSGTQERSQMTSDTTKVLVPESHFWAPKELDHVLFSFPFPELRTGLLRAGTNQRLSE